MKTWGIIENDKELKSVSERFEKIRTARKGEPDYKEKMLLLLLITKYEEQKSILPNVDPIEFIKIRMEDFGYKQSTLAQEYGDKGTISKVLNYKQPLTLTMIRKFSKLLRIPTDIFPSPQCVLLRRCLFFPKTSFIIKPFRWEKGLGGLTTLNNLPHLSQLAK